MIYLIILLAALVRLVPHIPNFAPITALAIFSAANLSTKKAIGITFAARLASDILLGFFAWQLMLAVYAAHLVGILFGLWIKKSEKLSWTRVAASSLGASLIFFLVTNFAFLYSGYTHDLQGIILAYTNGLPFFRATLLGDLSYTMALFGAYEAAKALAKHKALTVEKSSNLTEF